MRIVTVISYQIILAVATNRLDTANAEDKAVYRVLGTTLIIKLLTSRNQTNHEEVKGRIIDSGSREGTLREKITQVVLLKPSRLSSHHPPDYTHLPGCLKSRRRGTRRNGRGAQVESSRGEREGLKERGKG